MRTTTIFCFLLLTLLSCQSQNNNPETDRIVGGSCEGCEATLEYGNRVLNSVDTIPDFEQNDPKLKLSGTVYQQDGKTPAAGVILYFHQTNRDGIYPPRKGDTGWARRHGYHHSWLKTNEQGRYTLFTFRPGAYPGRNIAEHIHLYIKEPGKTAYYIDDFTFPDDRLNTAKVQKSNPNRGGSGVFQPVLRKGIFEIERDIILGLNIPDYN